MDKSLESRLNMREEALKQGLRNGSYLAPRSIQVPKCSATASPTSFESEACWNGETHVNPAAVADQPRALEDRLGRWQSLAK